MSEVSEKLRALMATKGLKTGAEWKKDADALAQRRASGEFEVDNVVPGKVVEEGDDRFYLVRAEYPLDTPHGGATLGDALNASPEHLAVAASDDEIRDYDPRTAVFVDTETSGLAGGTGTVTFLVGAGYFTDDAFVLEQCFMRDYDEEELMLRHLNGIFARSETVVSYNGKSFDVPLLRTRFISNRIPFRLDAAAHIDLVHAARRFWKLRIQDCSLGNVEGAILGVQREGDVPSWQIPQRWFDYLRNRDARPLEGVFYHHRMDILSLVTLTAHMSKHVGEPGGLDHEEDQLSMVRLHFRQKRFDHVVALAAAILERESREDFRREYLEMTTRAYKRLKRWDEMGETLRNYLAEFPSDPWCRLELAKLYEHRTQEIDKAHALCQETLTLLETRRTAFGDTTHWHEFTHRLARLEGKLARRR